LFLFSAHVKDLFETDCSSCSEAQRAGALIFLLFMNKNKPDKFNELLDKYDPDRNYYKQYEDMFKADASS